MLLPTNYTLKLILAVKKGCFFNCTKVVPPNLQRGCCKPIMCTCPASRVLEGIAGLNPGSRSLADIDLQRRMAGFQNKSNRLVKKLLISWMIKLITILLTWNTKVESFQRGSQCRHTFPQRQVTRGSLDTY